MKIDKNYKLQEVASIDQERPVLHGILIDGDAAVSTDGRMMVVCPVKRERGDSLAAVVIERAVIGAAQDTDSPDASIRLMAKEARATNKKNVIVSRKYVPLQFPDWKQVIPHGKAEDEVSVCLDARFLLRIAQAIGRDVDDTAQVKLTFHKKNQYEPIKVTSSKSKAYGLLMVCRDDA